jgi:hypothetical protein
MFIKRRHQLCLITTTLVCLSSFSTFAQKLDMKTFTLNCGNSSPAMYPANSPEKYVGHHYYQHDCFLSEEVKAWLGDSLSSYLQGADPNEKFLFYRYQLINKAGEKKYHGFKSRTLGNLLSGVQTQLGTYVFRIDNGQISMGHDTVNMASKAYEKYRASLQECFDIVSRIPSVQTSDLLAAEALNSAIETACCLTELQEKYSLETKNIQTIIDLVKQSRVIKATNENTDLFYTGAWPVKYENDPQNAADDSHFLTLVTPRWPDNSNGNPVVDVSILKFDTAFLAWWAAVLKCKIEQHRPDEVIAVST